MPTKPRVLFLCSANSARSQMAEALLRRHAGDCYEVHSAGIEAHGINPYTVRVLDELGVDTSQHRSKPLDEYLGRTHFGYLITVCDRAAEACPVVPGIGQQLHWPFEDPAAFVGTDEETMDRFRQIRDQIDAHIRQWLAEQA